MSQENASPKAFTATEALPRYRVVKLTAASGTAVEFADVDEAGIGITIDDALVGRPVAVALLNNAGTLRVTANEAFVVGASLFTGNDGKVQDTDPGTGTIRFIALEAASGDNSIVEILINGNATV